LYTTGAGAGAGTGTGAGTEGAKKGLFPGAGRAACRGTPKLIGATCPGERMPWGAW